MNKITPPKIPVPIGILSINGQNFEVKQHPEFVRFFFDLFDRVGGTLAPSNADLNGYMNELFSMQQIAGTDPGLKDAQQAIDELRNSVESTRNDCDGLRRLVDEREAEFAGLRGAPDLPTVNFTPGTFGDSTHVPVITVDEKGRTTTVSMAAISGGSGSPDWFSYSYFGGF